MYYFYGAAIVYVSMTIAMVRTSRPETWREVIGGVLGCTVLAALWPPVVLWGLLLGPSRAEN